MGLFTPYCFCWFLFFSFSFLCLNVFDCLLAIPVNRPSDLPQRGSSVVPFTPGQCPLDPSSHILFFRVHSAQVLWHWCAEPHSSCSVAVMSQGVLLSVFLSPFLLAQFSTKASFHTVLFAYEDGSKTFPLEQSPLKSLIDLPLGTEPPKVSPAQWVGLLWPPCLNQAQPWLLFPLHACGPGTFSTDKRC